MAELAAGQHGAVARWQLIERGVGAWWIQSAIERRHLHPIHHGVYAAGHPSLTELGTMMAAVLSGGAGALLSHQNAGSVWGFATALPGLVDVTVRRTGRGGRLGIRVHRPRRFPAAEARIRHGIPLTSPSRTLLDLAAVLPERQLLEALREADRRDLLEVHTLGALASVPGRRGRTVLLELLAAYRPPPETRSGLQDRFIELVDDAGLPRPAVDVVIEGFEVDCVWPAERLIVELDSWRFHGDRAAFERDRHRDARLQVAGYVVLRFTWERVVKDPAGVARDVAAVLRRPSGGRR